MGVDRGDLMFVPADGELPIGHGYHGIERKLASALERPRQPGFIDGRQDNGIADAIVLVVLIAGPAGIAHGALVAPRAV